MEENPYSAFVETVKGVVGKGTLPPFFTAKVISTAPFTININGVSITANRVNRRLLYEIEQGNEEQTKTGDTVLIAQVDSQTHIIICKVV